MSKTFSQAEMAQQAEDYELQPTSLADADEPLLPRYEQHLHHAGTPSPHARHELAKRHSRFRRSLACMCLSVMVFVPWLGLAACFFGRTTVQRVKGWDRVPGDWKQWLDKVVPGSQAYNGMFPTDVGYAGPTPTGSEAALLATAPALPMYSGVSPLVAPSNSRGSFNIIQHWGPLSPFYSVASHGLPETSSLFPPQCQIEEVHWLQRHGARYPTSGGDGPLSVAMRLKEAEGWTAKGDLAFLNDWEHKLGEEVLTPFGRQQLFNLGVSARLKYGNLLEKMDGRLPVFRTESQDRMLRSAQNFATGFFGYPAEEQYNLLVTIENPGFNNTLAPWSTCRADNADFSSSVWEKLNTWDNNFLSDAQTRLQSMIEGYEVSIKDAKDFMDMCAYETVALGYSSFCNLFTQKEWKGYEYRWDIMWWYFGSFGYPAAKAQGMGWVQEMVSRLTHSRITDFDSSINGTFHNDVQFPLNDPIYVDFTHDTVFALLLPTMNLTSFAETGEPPLDHIPKHRSFIASKFSPFATNLQIQVLSCSAGKQVRMILNDAAVPLTGINGCPDNDDGLCPFDAFVESMQSLIAEANWERDCGGI
ncbi:putative phytase [Naematelia encephala]|uniref:Putative phytase n=1 Tax=Naematelia encephala TaxID=71784 RepID=A0A1Y2BBE5_9TREE|nr:putative phytase [Naematelia encephala]